MIATDSREKGTERERGKRRWLSGRGWTPGWAQAYTGWKTGLQKKWRHEVIDGTVEDADAGAFWTKNEETKKLGKSHHAVHSTRK